MTPGVCVLLPSTRMSAISAVLSKLAAVVPSEKPPNPLADDEGLLQALFSSMDSDSSGKLSTTEFKVGVGRWMGGWMGGSAEELWLGAPQQQVGVLGPPMWGSRKNGQKGPPPPSLPVP